MHGVKFALISGVALFVCITPAKAERWSVVIQKDTDGTTYLANSDFPTDDSSPTKTFWTHAFYEMPRYGMKSLKVEYTVHCSNRTIVKQSYFEYDTEDNVVFSGKNNNDNSAKVVISGSVEDRLLTFACSSPILRKQNYTELNEK
ncbi:surface-adhesin E family protein, partial [Sphingorhabdus sp.]|uniref:surface-adhesin E family protein n=1 Tax=Sphingorhabdus sp. TaxID=1902408 RepID=UPI0039196C42